MKIKHKSGRKYISICREVTVGLLGHPIFGQVYRSWKYVTCKLCLSKRK